MDEHSVKRIGQCPILDEYRIDEGVYTFQKTLHKDEYFLSEHRIQDKAILPAAAYVEMVFAASSYLLNKNQRGLSLTNLMWLRHIEVENEHKKMVLLLSPGMNDSFRIEIKTASESCPGSWTTHMLAKMPAHLSFVMDDLKIEQKLQRFLVEKIKKHSLYQALRENGFFYGTRFQILDFVALNANEALSEVKLHTLNDRQAFIIHPVLLDGAIQTALFLLKSQLKNNLLYLPFSMARISLLQELTSHNKILIYTKLYEETLATDTPKFDIYLLSEQGETLLTMAGFILKKTFV
jgi:hypothetical protein